jgi:hypothetical protein
VPTTLQHSNDDTGFHMLAVTATIILFGISVIFGIFTLALIPTRPRAAERHAQRDWSSHAARTGSATSGLVMGGEDPPVQWERRGPRVRLRFDG